MKKVLIVEDDDFMADIYRGVLEAEGFEVQVCSNGSSAIQRLKEAAPHLILLDVLLPGTGGTEVLGFIRSQASTRMLPVIVLSNASAYAGDLLRSIQQQGANACLTKAECTPARLVQEVRAALAASSSPEDDDPSKRQVTI
jgi:CheY-like chemotaxis protein